MNVLKDTIVAVSTPFGCGGISIIRLSGDKVFFLMNFLFKKKFYPRIVDYCSLYNFDDNIIDNGVVIYFKSPNSFTGEDVLEFQCHGGLVIVNIILKIILLHGVRLAFPGEFTFRAFLNNKIDLIQAESISQIIFSKTESSVFSSSKSLNGVFSSHVRLLLNDISLLKMHIETNIDFSDENIFFLKKDEMIFDIFRLLKNLDILIKNIQDSKNVSYGINLAILGSPNSGKSTLMNLLSKEEVSIVDKDPGTTRDAVKSFIVIGGIKFNLIDTAGIRISNDRVEQEGIRRSIKYALESDFLLLIIDCSLFDNLNINYIYNNLFHFIDLNKFNHLIILNKCDLLKKKIYNTFINYNNLIFFSAKHGYGLNKLKRLILKKINYLNNDDSIFFVKNRHLVNIKIAREHLNNCYNYLISNFFYDFLGEELRLAQNKLMEILGENVDENFLDVIFSEFCIGK